MKNIVIAVCFFYAFSMNAERRSLTVQELEREADQVCTGRISAIYQKQECFNPLCTNFRIEGEVELSVLSCISSNASSIKARFFQEIYTDDFAPPGAYGHNPEPMLGQIGTLYIKAGEIVYPNGWLVTN
jgi:hypothetical protein